MAVPHQRKDSLTDDRACEGELLYPGMLTTRFFISDVGFSHLKPVAYRDSSPPQNKPRNVIWAVQSHVSRPEVSSFLVRIEIVLLNIQ
jgi:hypothetical protein